MARPKQDPIIEKSNAQTDQCIVGLSFKAFEEEFGFKPEDKIEQRHFANHGERLTVPAERVRLEKYDKVKKAIAKARGN